MQKTVSIALFTAFVVSAHAEDARIGDIAIRDPWVRGTVAGQKVTGAFMRIESATGAALVGASAPATLAGGTEIHESLREHNMAMMRPVARIDVAPGKPTDLKPGSYHVMLIDLRQQLKEGETVPIRLRFEQGGRRQEVEIRAKVRRLDHADGHHGEMK